MLVDDEELELRELQGRPNALGCYDHFTTNGWRSCLFTLQRLVTYRIFAWTLKPFLCFYFCPYYEIALLNGMCSVLCKIISSESLILVRTIVFLKIGSTFWVHYGYLLWLLETKTKNQKTETDSILLSWLLSCIMYFPTEFLNDPINAIAEGIPSSLHSGSGAIIKGLSTKQHGMPRPTWVHAGYEWCKRILYIKVSPYRFFKINLKVL
ncbi:unnamed protein product [Prunus brigantina]